MRHGKIFRALMACWSSKRFRGRAPFTVVELFFTSRACPIHCSVRKTAHSTRPSTAWNRVDQSEWIDQSAMGACRDDPNERTVTDGLRSGKWNQTTARRALSSS